VEVMLKESVVRIIALTLSLLLLILTLTACSNSDDADGNTLQPTDDNVTIYQANGYTSAPMTDEGPGPEQTHDAVSAPFTTPESLAGLETSPTPQPTPEPTPESELFADSIYIPLSALHISDDLRVVSFGEATHGSHDIKYLAGEVFKQLVVENGFRAFAIEASFGNCIAINEYILYGRGTARSVVANNGNWIHNFQEVVDLVKWMREYNLTAEDGDKLRFYGFDMQYFDRSLSRYLEYMATVDAEKANRDRIDIRGLSDASLYSAQLSSSDLPGFVRKVELMIEEAEQNMELYTMASSKSEFEYAIRNALCVKFCIEYVMKTRDVSKREGGRYRDLRMFENIRWIVE